MKRWGFIPLLFLCAVIVWAADWQPGNYTGRNYTVTTTDSFLVKWNEGVNAFIDTEPYNQLSFTFRVYDLMGDDAADSIQVHIYTTDFKDEGGMDTTDLADYEDIYQISYTDEGIRQFAIGMVESTAFGKYVAVQVRAWGSGNLNLGDAHSLRGEQ